MFIPRRFAPPLSKGDGCRTTYLPHISHHAASYAATDADKDPRLRPPLFKGAGGMQKSCPPRCQPCRNRCGQRPATAASPFQRGPGVSRSHAHHVASHAATDAAKDPQPRPPLFKRGRGYAEDMPTTLPAVLQPMQTKTRNRDLPFSKGPGVCRSPAHHAASHAAIDADKDPRLRPPLTRITQCL